MTILVTGGAGFIGSAFLLHMRARHPGVRLVCLDKLTYAGRLEHLAPLRDDPAFRFVQGDICDRDAVLRLFEEEKPRFCVNFAAESHVDRSIDDPSVFLSTNILGTGVLLEACRLRGTHFHQISTDEVYGALPLDASAARFTEQSPLTAGSPYSASKASADLLVLACRNTYGQPVTISRCSNNFGPRQYPEKLIPLMIERAQADLPLPVYGDGRYVRDWLYVDDHCEAVARILEAGHAGEVYNIGGDCELDNLTVIRKILAILGKPESLITHVKDRPGHDRRYAIDAGKLRTALGWRPAVDFDEGLLRTIAYMRGA